MSNTESPWNAEAPLPQSSNRKLWWLFGCAGAALAAFVVVGILATIFVPNIMARLASAQRAKIDADLSAIDTALESYKLRHGAYPHALSDLVAAGEILSSSGLPRDPWDHDYIMLVAEDPQSRPRLFTYGRDARLGGDGQDKDIEHRPR